MASLPLPLPAFLRAVEASGRPAWSPSRSGEAWNTVRRSARRRGDRGRASPSSLAGTIPCATPWLASAEQRRLRSGASDAKGREDRAS